MSVIDRSKLHNAFEFVTVASARARQLLEGCPPKVEFVGKTAQIAEQEVLTGAVQPLPADPNPVS